MLPWKDEVLYDFQLHTPRLLLTDRLVLADQVTRLVDFTDTLLVLHTGKGCLTEITGENLVILSFQRQRLVCSGKIFSVAFSGKAMGKEGSEKDEG